MQYTSKRVASAVLLFSMLASLLVACGGGGTSSGNGSGSGCSNVQLSYWTPFTGPDGPFMARLVAGFNNAHPDIQVQVTTQADYNTKLDTAAASNTLPDVAIINEDQIATQAFRHIIRPIDDIMSQVGYTSSDFPALGGNITQVAGHRYAIPLSIVPMTMYYNADLFKKAGISSPPTTGNDFMKGRMCIFC